MNSSDDARSVFSNSRTQGGAVSIDHVTADVSTPSSGHMSEVAVLALATVGLPSNRGKCQNGELHVALSNRFDNIRSDISTI